MAETVLYNIAQGIIGKLGSLTLQEIGLLWGIEDELQKLKRTVSNIRDVLLDAEEQSQYEKGHQVKGWLERLKEAVYDADDLLDDFCTENLRQKVMKGNKMAKQVRIFFSSSNQLVYGLKMAHQIKTIREQLEEIATDRKFHLDVSPVGTQVMNRERRQTHSFVMAEEVIGREDDKKKILQVLINSNDADENVLVIPIVGIGGLGKTTLAQYVYNHEKVNTHFELKMWVCVSDPFDLRIIVENIIKSVPGGKLDNLQNLLRKEIDGKKYLLVLDDVWNEDREKWLSLKTLLMGGARGSRILVTTRAEKVAKISSTVSPYVLKGLSEDESWCLFAKMAFERGIKPNNPTLIAIGKEIVKKCVGVPLAIRVIASLLYFKNTEAEWQSFKDNQLPKLAQQQNDIIPTLRLSYDHLPSHLKHCFAYCRLFPKDTKIDIQMLIDLWMAQGFIESEDDGLEYFKDLLWRSFFQEVEEDYMGNPYRCKMHDLMHDLAIWVAGKESVTLNYEAENSVGENTRHLSLDFNFDLSWQIPDPLGKANKIRTFLLLRQRQNCANEAGTSNSMWDIIFSSFRCLHVLDLHNSGVKEVPSSISKLKRLRYLDLSWNEDIKILPNSITKLQNLQTLKLNWLRGLVELPRDIKKMVSLMHLEIDGCWRLTHMPHGLGQLTSLRRLPRFVLGKDRSVSKPCGGLCELNKLNSLRGIVEIVNLECVKDGSSESKSANLKEKHLLQGLSLIWNREDGDGTGVVDDEMSLEGLQPHHNLKRLFVTRYGGVRFPRWLSSLTNLVSFHICNCKKFQHLPPLDQLLSLRTLILSELHALEYVSESDSSGSKFDEFSSSFSSTTFFPSLKRLELTNLPNLKGWWRVGTPATTPPSFPSLSFLEIKDCPMLTSMPLFPYLEKALWLLDSNTKPLQDTMMMTRTTTTAAQSPSTSSSSSVFPLSKLKLMSIKGMDDLESLPEERLRNLTSLQDLRISKCPRLASLSLSRGMQHLSSLQKLAIWDCKELDLSDGEDGLQWQGLRSLRTLEIYDLPKVVSLPKCLQHATAFQKLGIFNCQNLMALPEWIGNLTSLERLAITECPDLEDRCRKEMGEDWPKIAHIPVIEIDRPIYREYMISSNVIRLGD